MFYGSCSAAQPSTNKSDENPNKLKDGIDMLDIFLYTNWIPKECLSFWKLWHIIFFFLTVETLLSVESKEYLGYILTETPRNVLVFGNFNISFFFFF